jgi:hypothetical protein
MPWMPWFEDAIQRQMFYTTAFVCSFFDFICIFAIKCLNFLNVLSYPSPPGIPLISKLEVESGEQHYHSSS